MNQQENVDYVKYRMTRAKETLKEVEFLVENKLFYTAVNRLYYACFYAVSALLIQNEIKAKKHAGVKQMFGLHFVLTGKIDIASGEFYTYIFEKRQKSDYEDLISFNEAEVKELILPAQKLIKSIEHLLTLNQ